jgi:hypothetical protein
VQPENFFERIFMLGKIDRFGEKVKILKIFDKNLIFF